MATMLNLGNELVRIDPKDSKKIQYSTNSGSTWNYRYSGGNAGTFSDLTDNGKEILATTDKGLFYSTNKGSTWNKRS